MTTHKDYADPTALLEFDPAGVVIRATGNHSLLLQLDSFASSLKYYVDMMIRNNPNIATTTGAATQAAAPVEGPECVPSNAAHVSPCAEEENSDSSDSDSSDSEEESDEKRKKENGGSKGKQEKIVRPQRCTSSSATTRKRKSETIKEDTIAQNASNKRKKKQPPIKQEESDDDDDTKDQQLTLQEKLNKSCIRHSVGLTRSVISANYKSLGLSSPSIPVHMSVSLSENTSSNNPNSNNNDKQQHPQPSHLTFQDGSVDFPFTDRRNFVWRPKQGQYSLQLAEPLDPNKFPQEELPVFLSSGRSSISGKSYQPHLLYYVGHYQCVKFSKEDHEYEGVQRQAILEFKFVGFHKSMANKMTELASN